MNSVIIAFALAANCPIPRVINDTKTWTNADAKNLRIASKRCVVHYSDSPCLKVFEKTEERVYRATCGGNE